MGSALEMEEALFLAFSEYMKNRGERWQGFFFFLAGVLLFSVVMSLFLLQKVVSVYGVVAGCTISGEVKERVLGVTYPFQISRILLKSPISPLMSLSPSDFFFWLCHCCPLLIGKRY